MIILNNVPVRFVRIAISYTYIEVFVRGIGQFIINRAGRDFGFLRSTRFRSVRSFGFNVEYKVFL